MKIKKISIGLVAVILIVGLAALWFNCKAPTSTEVKIDREITLRTTAAHSNQLPQDYVQKSAATKVAPTVAASDRPDPQSGAPKAEVIDYRASVVPPLKKGGSEGVLREWLIRPSEGYVRHLEERYEPSSSGEFELVETREYVANQVLLTVEASVDRTALKAELEAKGFVVKEPLMGLDKGGAILAISSPRETFEAAEDLMNAIRRIDPRLSPELDPIMTISRTPNDPRYAGLWGLEKIAAPEAWDLGVSATNVVVAVLDTGVNYFHEDLTDNIWRDTEELDFPWVKGARIIGGKLSYEPMDDNGHGSHCAGTIAARGNNGKGVVGVGWKTRLMPIKVLNYEGTGAFSDILSGFAYARKNGADIINCSFGGGMGSGAAWTAIEQLRIMGVTLSCAAGNDGKNNEKVHHYPSDFEHDNIIAVAATDVKDELAGFSNYGVTSVDIGAPGVDILSSCTSYRSADTCYASLSGTSMSAPHVSGALALVRGRYPEDHYFQTIQRLLLNGDEVESLDGKTTSGMRLNLYKAMMSFIPPAPIGKGSEGTYEDKVVLSWKPVGGAMYYQTWRRWSEDPEETLVLIKDWSTDCSAEDVTAEKKVGYHYFVRCSKHEDGHDASPFSRAIVGYKTVPIEDEWDPTDDVPEGATVLTPTGEEQVHGQHTLNPKDPYDWYRVQVRANETYVFESVGVSDLSAELFDAPTTNNENRVAVNDDSGEDRNFKLVYAPIEDGSVYLRVRRWDESINAFYQLKYVIAGFSDQWDHVDDTSDGATELTPEESEQSHGLHALSATDVADFYRVEMTAGETYVFSSVGDTDTFAELYRGSVATGNVVAWNDDANDDRLGSAYNFRLVYTVPEGSDGVYYLKVRLAPSGGVSGTYTLNYRRTISTADFTFTPDEIVNKVKGWESNVFAEQAENGQWLIKWAFNESEYRAVAQDVINLVELFDKNGVRLAWGQAIATGGLGENEFYDFTTEMPDLPPGAYTVKLTLNSSIDGVSAVPEENRTDNVRIVGFTVLADGAKPIELAIEGNSEVNEKDSAKYRAIATLADGSTLEVSPRWSIVSGSAAGSISADGTLKSVGVTELMEVTIRAVFDGLIAVKNIRVVPEARYGESAFNDPVIYPSEKMTASVHVFVNGVLAAKGDEIAAFVGNELRGRAKLDAKGSAALSISIGHDGETVSFKLFASQEGDGGLVLACTETIHGIVGGDYGDLELNANLDDPFPMPDVGGNWQQGWKKGKLRAKVTVNGRPAAAGDILAVYAGDTLVGKKMISLVAALGGFLTGESICDVDVSLKEPSELSFILWDHSRRVLCGSTTHVVMKPNETIGSEALSNRFLVETNDKTRFTLRFDKSGWHLVSVNVLPDAHTLGDVFSVEGISQVIDGAVTWVAGQSEESSNLEIGSGYWLQTTQDDVVLELEGISDESKEIQLTSGWNLVGYTLGRPGRIDDVLGDALKAGKVTEIVNGAASYPYGNLTMMQPGEAYWMYSPSACTISFKRLGQVTALGGWRVYGPFGTEEDIVREPLMPTRYTGVQVLIDGVRAGFGDVVAVFDSRECLRALATVEDTLGVVSFPVYAATGTSLHAKVWSASAGKHWSAEDSFVMPEAGSEVDDLTIVVKLPKESSENRFEVTFDVGEKGVRVGGGELRQSVAFGGSAIAPTVEAKDGFSFVGWNTPFADVRANKLVKALYAEKGYVDMSDAKPETKRQLVVAFNSNGGSGEMRETTINYDSPSSALPENSYSRDGYTFLGWSTQPDGDIVLNDLAKTGEIAEKLGLSSGSTTLYAQWAYDGFKLRVGTCVANAGRLVDVPLYYDSDQPIACVAVKIAYDPTLMELASVRAHDLAKMFDDDFTVTRPTDNTVGVGFFASANVVAGSGCLATLTFRTREGTEGLFSDVTIVDVQLADETAVKDVTDAKVLLATSGLVRIVAADAEVARLEEAQVVAPRTCMKRLSLTKGDGISADQTREPIVVSDGVWGADGRIPVRAPSDGWSAGVYELLRTSTHGLAFELEGTDDYTVEEKESDGLVAYSVKVRLGTDDFRVKVPVAKAEDGTVTRTISAIVPREWFGRDFDFSRADRVLRALNAPRNHGNRMTLLENYLLGLVPDDEKSKPIITGRQTGAADSVGFALGGIKPPEDSEMSILYRVHELDKPEDTKGKAIKSSKYVPHNQVLEVPLSKDKLRFYRIEIDFQPK